MAYTRTASLFCCMYVTLSISLDGYPDSKAYRANMGPIWGWQGPGGHNVGPMNLAVWVTC